VDLSSVASAKELEGLGLERLQVVLPVVVVLITIVIVVEVVVVEVVVVVDEILIHFFGRKLFTSGVKQRYKTVPL
jgi:hypothetical protein